MTAKAAPGKAAAPQHGGGKRWPLEGGGWIRTRAPEQITPRRRRPIEILIARLGTVPQHLTSAARVFLDGDLLEDRTDQVSKDGARLCTGPDLHLTERQWILVHDMNLAIAWALLEAWSLPDPLPATPDELLDVPPGVYDTVMAAAAVATAQLVGDGAPSVNGTTKPAAKQKRPRAVKPPPAVPARVVVPFVDLHPRTRELLDEHVPGWIAAELDRDDDDAYWRLISDEWARPGDLVIIEQDIGIAAGVIDGLTACAEAWCGHPYWTANTPIIALGCTRFSATLKTNEPDIIATIPERRPEDVIGRHWLTLDAAIHHALTARGYTVHKHSPEVQHFRTYEQVEEAARIARL